MGFVTDCIWRSPLGLKINAQDTAGTSQTEDWVKIRGDQLVPRDGYYDLRISAELRETHFFDHLGLMTVDHPDDTDIFVDERFAFPQPPRKVYAMTPTKPFAMAVDDNGSDVSEIVRERDKVYLDNFGRGAYQGVTRDHYVEVTLGDDVPVGKPVYLVRLWLGASHRQFDQCEYGAEPKYRQTDWAEPRNPERRGRLGDCETRPRLP